MGAGGNGGGGDDDPEKIKKALDRASQITTVDLPAKAKTGSPFGNAIANALGSLGRYVVDPRAFPAGRLGTPFPRGVLPGGPNGGGVIPWRPTSKALPIGAAANAPAPKAEPPSKAPTSAQWPIGGRRSEAVYAHRMSATTDTKASPKQPACPPPPHMSPPPQPPAEPPLPEALPVEDLDIDLSVDGGRLRIIFFKLRLSIVAEPYIMRTLVLIRNCLWALLGSMQLSRNSHLDPTEIECIQDA